MPHVDHARHDLTLIAAHAAGDLSNHDRTMADVLLSTCEPCADLRRDLVAISAATRSLPAPAALRRDLRLEPEQAARLRRGSWLREALRPFAASRSAVRPMAAAFTSLGVAGLLVATILPGLFGSVASSAPTHRDLTAAQAAATSAPENAPGGLGHGPAPSIYRANYDGASTPPNVVVVDGKSDDGSTAAPVTAAPVLAAGGANPTDDSTGESAVGDTARLSTPTVNPLITGSLGLLGVGLLLYGLRFAGRRLR